MSSLPHIPNSILSQPSSAQLATELSEQLADIFLTFVQKNRRFLLSNYQAINWNDPKHHKSLNLLIKAEIDKGNRADHLTLWFHYHLSERLFNPIVFSNKKYKVFLHSIKQFLGQSVENFIYAPITQPRENTIDSPIRLESPTKNELISSEIARHKSESRDKEGIAVLLLDAENLSISQKEEDLIQQHCSYPIQVKLAFANWRSLNKDKDLYDRNYDLVHVPKGKNHADGKMIAVGASILNLYPKTQAVLICSSDTIMSSLCSQLTKEGIEVHIISRVPDHLIISKYGCGKESEIKLDNPAKHSKTNAEIIDLNKAIEDLMKIVANECKNSEDNLACISQVSSQFMAMNSMSIKQLAAHYQKGATAKSFFKRYTKIFKIHDKPSSFCLTLIETIQ